MISIALCILLCVIGHLVRDGWPPWRESLDAIGRARWPSWLQRATNPTQLARIAGALWCTAGAALLHTWGDSLLIGAAVLTGFYTDMKHGEGQGPDDTRAHTWHNAPFLLVSGLTSLLPLALLAHWLHWSLWPPVLAWGALKPSIWFFSWWLSPNRWWGWLYPTRLAAMLFGALVGVIIAWGV